jgi:genome maintenance exonuclease 1
LIDAPDETGVSRLSVCDWKTSERLRSREMITNYCDQLGAYSLGLTELTGLKAQQGIVVIARRTGEPQAHYLSRFQLKQCETQFLERCTDYYDALLK